MAIYMDMVPSTMAKDLNDRVGSNFEGHDGGHTIYPHEYPGSSYRTVARHAA